MFKPNNQSKRIIYHPPEINHDLFIDVFTNIPKRLSGVIETKRHILVVYDAHLPKSLINEISSLLNRTHVDYELLEIKYGKKSLKKVRQIWTKMVVYHPDFIIALGGGLICDLVAFSASCYHRGIDHAFIPTTLLSAIDASIGGKTGIDFGGIKNSVGSIHYARHVYVILPLLCSVKKRELFSGLSEAIKAGMLFDKKVVDWLESLKIDSFEATSQWMEIIYRCAKLKASFTEKPMIERSRLLYGHNIGHAIETYSGKHVRHGDAVAIGMQHEGALGVILGVMSKEAWQKQFELLKHFGLPNQMPSYINKVQLINSMKKYKLFINGELLFVIPINPGNIYQDKHGYYVRITESKFSELYDEMIKFADKS